MVETPAVPSSQTAAANLPLIPCRSKPIYFPMHQELIHIDQFNGNHGWQAHAPANRPSKTTKRHKLERLPARGAFIGNDCGLGFALNRLSHGRLRARLDLCRS
ncbi:hypothetical protein, partial [Burkholderia vietnamiensis]